MRSATTPLLDLPAASWKGSLLFNAGESRRHDKGTGGTRDETNDRLAQEVNDLKEDGRQSWMRALLIIAVGLMVVLLPVATVRGENNGAPVVVRQYLVGADLLCTLNIPQGCPDVAMASNGDRIGISGQGAFTVQDGDNNQQETEIITGGGTFMHNDSAGNILATGTWTATELLSFTSFGTNPVNFPANFEGGTATMEIHLSPAAGGPGLDGVLEITCLVGSPPAGAVEGITLAVEDGPNFNTPVSGITLFILQS